MATNGIVSCTNPARTTMTTLVYMTLPVAVKDNCKFSAKVCQQYIAYVNGAGGRGSPDARHSGRNGTIRTVLTLHLAPCPLMKSVYTTFGDFLNSWDTYYTKKLRRLLLQLLKNRKVKKLYLSEQSSNI